MKKIYQYRRVSNPGGFAFGFQLETAVDLLCGLEYTAWFFCASALPLGGSSRQTSEPELGDLNPDVTAHQLYVLGQDIEPF